MRTAHLADVALDYDVLGSGEPVLFISPVLSDGFLPLLKHRELVGSFKLLHYHRRGWVGSTRTSGPVSIGQHVTDALALLDHLRIRRAHVVGHSSGAAVATQLALDHSDVVHSLTLLELSLLSMPEGREFLRRAGPVFDMYQAGNHEDAFAAFMTAVSGLDWESCRATLESRVPGAVDQSIQDAETFFGIELPSLAEWSLPASQAAAIKQPTLSVHGSETLPLWVEVAAFLRTHVQQIRDVQIDGVGHLLHIQRPDPVAAAIAEFLGEHPM